MRTCSTSGCRGRPKLSSSTSETATFGGVFSSPALDAATSDLAWLQAMLDVEAALARAGARAGLLPADAASRIAGWCQAGYFDVSAVATAWSMDATPVVALVHRLRELAGDDARHVHVAATSQDVLDTATMLVARAALDAVGSDAAAVTGSLAGLARAHRDTVQVGRTLLQQGEVTTFGAACAGRLAAIDEALAGLASLRRERLAVQLGGAVGTLGRAGEHGAALIREFAAELDLREPLTPWHTSRGRVAELAGAAGVLCGELAALAQDLVLLSASEIGEVSPASPGASSAMAHKRNPAAAVLALACAHRVPGLVATVLAGMPQELQRSAGRWQAEWSAITELLRLAGGTARHTQAALAGLVVDGAQMAAAVAALAARTGVSASVAPSAGIFVDRALAAHDALARAASR